MGRESQQHRGGHRHGYRSWQGGSLAHIDDGREVGRVEAEAEPSGHAGGQGQRIGQRGHRVFAVVAHLDEHVGDIGRDGPVTEVDDARGSETQGEPDRQRADDDTGSDTDEQELEIEAHGPSSTISVDPIAILDGEA